MQRNLLALVALVEVLSSCALDPALPPDAGPPDVPPDAGTDAGPPDAGLDGGAWHHVDPFFVEARPTALQVRAGGSVTLTIAVARAPGFHTPVEVAVFGLPPGTATTSTTVGPSTDSVTLRIDADRDAATAGPRAFALSAEADGIRQTLRVTIEVVP